VADSDSRELRTRVRWLLVLVLVVVAYGVVGYMLLEGWSFLDALFMTVTTLTTVGFREVHPLDASGRVFTITVIVLGVGLVLVTIAVTAQWVLEGSWGERNRRRRMQRRIEELSDHFIVCAYGRVGRAVARELEAARAPFLVVDPKEELIERMTEDGVAYLTEDPSEEPVLRAAGVERARGLVCAVDSDATNVYITLIARSLKPDLFIVARASEPGSDERLRHAGADRVISPYVSSGRHMARVALRPAFADVLAIESAGSPSIEVDEVRVDETTSLDGRTVAAAFPDRPVLAVRRRAGTLTPNPPRDLRLELGDLILLLGQDQGGDEPRASGGR
jgi:voltage-gated potassium channel